MAIFLDLAFHPMKIAPVVVLKYLGMSIGVAIVYFAVARAGLIFAIPPGNATAVWPASGIALAALLLIGLRIWPAIWIASALVSFTTGVSLATVAAFATGNTLEGLLATVLIQRFLPARYFSNAGDAFKFLLIAMVSCIPAACAGAGSLLLADLISAPDFSPNLCVWWIGDLAGQVIVAPPLLALANKRWGSFDIRRITELLLLLASQVALSAFIFGGILPATDAEKTLYLPMLLLIWGCLRFSLLEVTTSTFLFSAAAVWGTSIGLGAYSTAADDRSLLDLQLMLVTYAATALVLSSIIAGRHEMQKSLTKSRKALRRETTAHERAERWFRQLMTASPDTLIVCNADGDIILASDSAEELFGYSQQELIGQKIEIVVPPRFRDQHRQFRQQYTESPYVRLMGSGPDLMACRKDGTEFPAEIALGPMQADDGIVIFSSIRDVSSRKRAERALRDSEERFELAVLGTDAGIWDWDLRNNDVFFSPRWKSMLGYEDEEITSDFKEWQERLHPDDRERAIVCVQEYLEGKSSEFELDHRLRHRNGSYRWILSRGAVVRNEQGKAYRMVGSHLDITERRELEEQLRAREAELVAAQRIQQHLLPQAPPKLQELDIDGFCDPADFAGGDHFDYLTMADGRLGIAVGDVTGHGIGPALVAASTQTRIRVLSRVSSDIRDILSETNSALGDEIEEERFVTLIMVCFDPHTHCIEYVNAGHPSGYVLNAAGETKAVLKSDCPPLGLRLPSQFPQREPIKLEPGDLVLLLTDGIPETQNPEGDLFGMASVVSVVLQNREKSATAILGALRKAATDFSQGRKQSDDLTAVIMKVNASS